MIKRSLILLMLLFHFMLYGQDEKIDVVDRDIFFIEEVIEKQLGYSVYVEDRDEINSLKFSISCDKELFIDELKKSLSRHKIDLVVEGRDIYIFYNLGLHFGVAENFFDRSVESDAMEGLTRLDDNPETVINESKLYTIGDPNRKEPRGIVLGHIKNRLSGEPLKDAVISIDSLNITSVTNSEGHFRIVVPAGEWSVNISAFGMEEMNLAFDVYGNGNVDIMMNEIVYSLKGAVVSAGNRRDLRSTHIGLERITMEKMKHIPTVFGETDVFKIVLTLPGVKSVGEASGGFNVRGGSTDQNLILFNGGTMYNPMHLFGMFSAFNPDIVNDIELYKSSIPAKLGGRISSVLEVNNKKGSSKKVGGSMGIGPLMSKIYLEGPLGGERTSFVAGFRMSHINWLLKHLPENSSYQNGKAGFGDLTLGLDHKFENNSTLRFSGYLSDDSFSFNENYSFNYSNKNVSLRYKTNKDNNREISLLAGYDRYDQSVTDTRNFYSGSTLKFAIEQYYLKADFNHFFNTAIPLNWGVNMLLYNISPGETVSTGRYSMIKEDKMEREKAVEADFYISREWEITDRFSIETGLRYSFYSALGPKEYYRYNSEYDKTTGSIADTIYAGRASLIKPYHGPQVRISGRYRVNKDLSIKAGINTMRQNIHLLSNTISISPTDTWKLSDANIKPQYGWQLATGLYYNIDRMGGIELSMESYYKEMYRFLDYKSGAVLNMNKTIEQDVLETRGRAYGVELMAKKNTGKLNGWISYTYSRIELKESGKKESYIINNGEWYPASYDKPHDVKVIVNYKLTHRFSFSFNLDYSTGRPITLPIGVYIYDGIYRYYYSDRNEYRIPDYFRIDVAFNVEPHHRLTRKINSTLTFGVYNVTGRKNAYSVYYDNSGGGMSSKMLTVFGTQIPHISYHITF